MTDLMSRSNLLIQEGPAVEPLTLAEAKDHLRLDGTDEDATVSACIVAARQACESYTGLSLISQTWQLYLDRWPAGAIELPRPPLQAVLAVNVLDAVGERSLLDPARYVVDRGSGPARLLRRGTLAWPRPGRAIGGIEITYRSGFGDSWNDVPAALRQGMLLAVAHFFERREGEAGLPPAIAALWQPYRILRL